MAKIIKFDTEARTKMLTGVNTLGQTINVTMPSNSVTTTNNAIEIGSDILYGKTYSLVLSSFNNSGGQSFNSVSFTNIGNSIPGCIKTISCEFTSLIFVSVSYTHLTLPTIYSV